MNIKKRKNTKFIVLHTAAFDGEFNAEICRAWHQARGWQCEGYNFIIGKGGSLETTLRGESGIGAHCLGLNSVSIGICLAGNGDATPWTGRQIDALRGLVQNLRFKYGLTPHQVIGHREVGKINARYATTKTCPGKLIDMDEMRTILNYSQQGLAIL